MRKIFIFLITAVLLISEAGGFVRPLKADAEPDSSQIEYSNDFSSGSMEDFKSAGEGNGAYGSWSVSGGKLRVSGAAGANKQGSCVILAGKVLSDLTMEFDAEFTSDYGVIIRAEDNGETAGSGLNTAYGGNAYVLMHWNPGQAWASADVRDLNGSSTKVASAVPFHEYSALM